VPIVDAVSITPRSRLLTLDLQDAPFTFLAGQAVMIGAHGQQMRRPYSIASSPERARERHALELLIGLDVGGRMGPHLPSAEPGTRVDVQGPMGSFTFPERLTHTRLLFVGGGTGIAPLRAMLDHALRAHPAERISLLYSARRADEFAFIDEFQEHERSGRLELHPTVTRDDESWAGGRGRIGKSHFEAVVHEPQDTLGFICGPHALVGEAVATLVELGMPRAAIKTEEWAAPDRGPSDMRDT
jgi:NAD(P)H-flavin reductase